MKAHKTFILIISLMSFATIAKAACLDENEQKQASRTNHETPLNQWSTPELLEIASLLKEQRFWVLIADAMINEIPALELAKRGTHFNFQIMQAVAGEAIKKLNLDDSPASEEQRKKGLSLLLSFKKCKSRYNKNDYQRFLDTLACYADMPIFEPLYTLIKLFQHQNSREKTIIVHQFINNYKDLAPLIEAIIRRHKQILNNARNAFQTVLDELVLRTAPPYESLTNIFTGVPFVFSDPQTPEVSASNVVDQTSNQSGWDNLIPSLMATDENQKSPDLDKLHIDQLLEIASLLEEQGTFMIILDDLSSINADDAELPTVNESANHPLEKQLGQICFGEERFSELLEKHPYKELAPLKKHLQLHAAMRTRFGTYQFTIAALHSDPAACQKMLSGGMEIIKIYDAIFNDIRNLYNNILMKLMKQKAKHRSRISSISGNVLPQTYRYARPVSALPIVEPSLEQIERAPVTPPAPATPRKRTIPAAKTPARKVSPAPRIGPAFDTYEMQEYLMTDHVADDIYVMQKYLQAGHVADGVAPKSTADPLHPGNTSFGID